MPPGHGAFSHLVNKVAEIAPARQWTGFFVPSEKCRLDLP